MTHPSSIAEAARRIPVTGDADVLVAGAGPAGVSAAVAAARAGAKVQLIDVAGCLGGIWTVGLLSWMLDVSNKTGFVAELIQRLEQEWGERHGDHFLTRPETCKIALDQLCLESGVLMRLHTRVVGARVDGGRITHVVTESKSGREAWAAQAFVDATGDGDLGAVASCGWDYANPVSGEAQPFSLIGLVTGLELDAVADCVRMISEARALGSPKKNLLLEFQRAGLDPSYHAPFMAHLGKGLFLIMWNHVYGVCGFDAGDVTRATLESRAELHRLVKGLRGLGGRWNDLQLVATAEQIGTREGRRIHGRYTITESDLRRGTRFADAVCQARFGFDVHSTNPDSGKAGHHVGRAQPYEIPLRALVSVDRDNLFLAGRCLSGDFLAHSSYRVTGNAAATGEAAGMAAAEMVLHEKSSGKASAEPGH